MRKSLFVIITLLLVTALASGWYFFARESRYLGSSPIKAIPTSSPFFVKVRNLGDFAGKSVKNNCWKSLQTFGPMTDLFGDLVLVDSLMRYNQAYGNLLKNMELYVVPVDDSAIYLLEIGSIAEKNGINSLVRNYLLSGKRIVTTENYKNAVLQHYDPDKRSGKSSLTVVFFKGILMFSRKGDCLKTAIDQLTQKSLLEETDFLRINKNATENADLNLFVNHKTFPRYFSRFSKDSLRRGLMMPKYAQWTEVDLLQKENQLFVNGYTVSDSTGSSFVDVFKHQIPKTESILGLMPGNTTCFAALNVSEVGMYFSDYEHFIKNDKNYIADKQEVTKLSANLDLDLRQYLISHWTGEAAAVLTNQNLADKSDNRFFLIRVTPGLDPLVNAIKKWSASVKTRELEPDVAEAERNNIWLIPTGNFGKLVCDPYFGSLDTRWMTAADGYILMGATPGSLRRYLDLLKNGKRLDTAPIFASFSSGLARTSNFYFWCSPGSSLPFLEPVIRPDFSQIMSKGLGSLFKIENLAWQWGCENGRIYNTASLVVNPEAMQNQLPFWQFKLKAGLRDRPQFVSYYSKSTKRDLLFQDTENRLTDLVGEGMERWSVHLDGAIMGTIKTVDFNKNGESQLLFNTREAIHLIDRNGMEMKGFPVRLKSPATNELALFDYDKNRDYRYLIACSDHRVYNLDKHGKPIPGWQPKPTTDDVVFPVRHFRVGTRDYIVFFDRLHTYVVDRQGKERLSVKDEYVRSKNAISRITTKGEQSWMVGTDEHGKVRLLGFDGSAKKIATGNFSSEHYFLPVDFNGNGDVRFVFIDKKKIALYDFAGHQVYAHPLDFSPDRAPVVLNIAGEKLIELYSEAEHRTLLVKEDGSFFDHFLPEKCTFPEEGSLDGNEGVLNRLGSTSDGFLSNYQMIVK